MGPRPGVKVQHRLPLVPLIISKVFITNCSSHNFDILYEAFYDFSLYFQNDRH